jgi:DNA polymerase I-like protein with 3'-5' exonuclease and polymerase domains
MTLYPDLSCSKVISLDIETYDPGLLDLGPGVYRGDGFILGVSLANEDGFSEYYNLGHYDCDKQEREKNIAYLRGVLKNNVTKIGQSIIYDLDWLINGKDKIEVNGKVLSIDIAEALIDETQLEYNMDFMGKKYLGLGKKKTKIDKFCEENGYKGDSRAWLWKMPYSLVREYAAQDAYLPVEIYKKQKPLLEEQELVELFEMECKLIRCLVFFRKTGVRIDADKRDRNGLIVQNKIELLQSEMFKQYGVFNCNSSQQVAGILDKLKIAYPLTPKKLKVDGTYTAGGNPAINAYFYKRYREEYEFVEKVYQLKQARHHLDSFIMGSHLRFVCPDGLIHPQFFNMRNDMLGALKGTRSGRLSGANPNLQQQPSISKDEYWGTICREDFIPFEDCWWGVIDYSQIEYRFTAHFATGEGSQTLRDSYIANPKIDYHQFIMDLTGLKRKLAKNLNFGIAYGMGAKHMAETFGWDIDYAYEVLNIYHSRAPYIKTTMKSVEQVARRRGYIRTFLKRRSHLTDPKKAYTMFCRLIQGSAADLMKSALLTCYEDGVFDVLYPHITVHDEIDTSVPKSKIGIDAFKEMQHTMETALTLKVPIIADAEIGSNWATTKEFEWADLYKEV